MTANYAQVLAYRLPLFHNAQSIKTSGSGDEFTEVMLMFHAVK